MVSHFRILDIHQVFPQTHKTREVASLLDQHGLNKESLLILDGGL